MRGIIQCELHDEYPEWSRFPQGRLRLRKTPLDAPVEGGL